MNSPAIQAGGCTNPPRPPGWPKQLLEGVSVSAGKGLSGLAFLAGVVSLLCHAAVPGGTGAAIAGIVGVMFGIVALCKSTGWVEMILGAGVSLANAVSAIIALRGGR